MQGCAGDGHSQGVAVNGHWAEGPRPTPPRTLNSETQNGCENYEAYKAYKAYEAYEAYKAYKAYKTYSIKRMNTSQNRCSYSAGRVYEHLLRQVFIRLNTS